MSSDDDRDLRDVAAALDAGEQLGAQCGEVRELENGVPFMVLPNPSYKLQSLENFLLEPKHTIAVVDLRDAVSFIAYLEKFATDNTTVFYDAEAYRIVAILDYHGAGADGAAARGLHRAVLKLQLTEEWGLWAGNDKKFMPQLAFAEFLEDHLPTIADPPGAEILEVAQNLEAHREVKFASSVRLSNGQHQLTYEETTAGSSRQGAFKIPETFALGIVPFEGAVRYRLDARFRYRIGNGGALTLQYALLQPEAVLKTAFNDVLVTVTEGIAAPIFAGVAPTMKRE